MLLIVLAIPAWGQVGSATLFSDDFGRTTGLGNNWEVTFGSFTTDGNHAISGTPLGNGNWVVGRSLRGHERLRGRVADFIIPSGSTFSGVVARSCGADFDHNLFDRRRHRRNSQRHRVQRWRHGFRMGETVAFRGSFYVDSSTYQPDSSIVFDAFVQWRQAPNAIAGQSWYGALIQLGISTFGGLATPSVVFGVGNSWDRLPSHL